MKTLQIIETAYRATLEEQDDPILWLTQAMRGAGGDLQILLCGNAVTYAVPEQNAAGLRIGTWVQKNPPYMQGALEWLKVNGVEIFAVEEDLEERGLLPDGLLQFVKAVPRSALASLHEGCERIWRW